MTNEKLVQSEDMYEDLYCEDMHEDRVCPRCSSLLQHDYALSIETGSLELVWVCYQCGHTE